MPPPKSPDRRAQIFIWCVWMIMTITALGMVVRYGSAIPLAEDWLLVAPLTGHEHNLMHWLWAQNNEHRIPLPRLLLLMALKVTHGDFRIGMILNILTLSALSGVMIVTARRVRGGSRFADGVFPLLLLHLGNWPNLIWGWQFTFVLSSTLTYAILLILVTRHKRLSAGSVGIAAGCLISLPLCGATGLIFVPLLALWFGYEGYIHRQQNPMQEGPGWISPVLCTSAITAIVLTGFYFVGYETPSWNPPNPGIRESVKTALKFLALAFGPAAADSWKLSIMGILMMLLPTILLIIRAVWYQTGSDKFRAVGIFLFLANLGGLTLTMGWGRAGYVPTVGLPIRYVILAVPALVTAFFIWELYGPSKFRSAFQNGLLVLMLILLPLNTHKGLSWGQWYQGGMKTIREDIAAGHLRFEIADRHRDFLIHWWEKERLADHIHYLTQAGMGPFAQLQGTADSKQTPQGIRPSSP